MEKTEQKSSTGKKVITYGILAAAVVTGLVFGWNYYQDAQSHIETDDAQVDGNIVPVLTRTSGYIGQVLTDDNQFVKKGTLVATLDTLELGAKLEQALAAYHSAQSQLEVARAQVNNAESARKVALTSVKSPETNVWQAQQEYDRYNDLYQQKAATQQQYDRVKANLENAKAQLAVARQRYQETGSQYTSALDQVKVAEATVEQRKKDVDYARLQLSYTKVFAPVSGIVTKKNIQPGQLVQNGQPLLSIVQDSTIWVTANYKETQLEGMQPGQTVDIEVDAYPGTAFSGKVESFGGATGAQLSLLPPDNASGNFVKVVQRIPIRIAINPTPEAKKYLRPGLSVIARINKN